MMTFPIYGKIKKSSKPPTRYIYIWGYNSMIYMGIMNIWEILGDLWERYGIYNGLMGLMIVIQWDLVTGYTLVLLVTFTENASWKIHIYR